MSGTVFVGNQILLQVSFDAARCQLQRLAPDAFLLSASEYAYAAGITGLAEEAGLAAVLARLGHGPETCWRPRGVPGSRCDGRRSVLTAPSFRPWMSA